MTAIAASRHFSISPGERDMKFFLAASLLLVAMCTATSVHAGDAEAAQPQLAWQRGPATGAIGSNATIDIPQDYVFLDVAETTRYVEMSENLPSGEEQLFAPTSGDWDAYFSFAPEGYVKDSETLDADALLETIRSNQKQANAERRRRGWAEFTITGWHIAPRYNPETRVLEWATTARAAGSDRASINYNTKILGRKGVMSVQLVSTPEKFAAGLAAFQDRLDGFKYKPGDRYADYKAGDHVAEYGLAALVAGGAAAVAAKKGFFGAIAAFLAAAWKFVLMGIVGVGVWLKSLFGKKKGTE
jgi:uncharacterized membrane-anchored protein